MRAADCKKMRTAVFCEVNVKSRIKIKKLNVVIGLKKQKWERLSIHVTTTIY